MELNFPRSQIYFHIASMLTDVQNEVHVKLPILTGNVHRCGLMRDSHFYFSTKASCHLRFLCLNNRNHLYPCLWTCERSWQETQRENLWERHVSASQWDGQSLTFPSTPTPQSASWIMLTSFPPSPKRKQKPWRCQDSHQWFTTTNYWYACVCVCILQDTP